MHAENHATANETAHFGSARCVSVRLVMPGAVERSTGVAGSVMSTKSTPSEWVTATSEPWMSTFHTVRPPEGVYDASSVIVPVGGVWTIFMPSFRAATTVRPKKINANTEIMIQKFV